MHALTAARTALAALVPAALLLCCSPTDSPSTSPAGRARSPVNNGVPDTEHEATVLLLGGMSSCSGSVIAPNVVLTANHCVAGTTASSWVVRYGQNPLYDPSLTGIEIVSPGPFHDYSEDDIAMLVVGRAVPTPTYLAASELEPDLLGSDVTIVGYGLDENGDSGVRLMGTQRVVAVERYWLELRGAQSANSGDSGGTVLDRRGQVVGVISRGGRYVTIATRVDAFRRLVDPVLRENGGCIPGDPEACDGVDNDCDGEVDEGCLALYDRCESAETCTSGRCEELGGERVCTTTCAPEDSSACGAGGYCFRTSCGAGLCREGSAGPGAFGAECGSDLECASLFCQAGAEAPSRCTVACRADRLDCPSTTVCELTEGECGSCRAASEVAGARGLGEACEGGSECRSGLCAPTGTCAVACPPGCPEATHCREGLCVPGELGGPGAPCLSAEDCEAGICQAFEDGPPVCTEPCGAGDPCPSRWTCDFEARRCEPLDVPLGGLCAAGDETVCIEGECLEVGGALRCSRPCGAFCPPGLDCVESAGGGLCAPNGGAADGAGCACRAGASSPGTGLAAVALAALAAAARRLRPRPRRSSRAGR